MTDSKTPEWAREAAQAFHDKWETGMSGAAFRDFGQALLSAYERGRAERAAEIAVAEQALKDWLHVYAPDLCDPSEVEKAKARIGEHGTIAYIARALEALAPPAKENDNER